jgi:kumamolisin
MSRFITLPGSQRTLLPNSQLAGPVDRSERISFTVRVRSKGELPELEEFVTTESHKPIGERKYLTHAQLASRFGSKQEDLTAVEQYAAQHDLLVGHRSAAERTVKLIGELGDVLRAFPTHLNRYHHSLGTYRGRSSEIEIPDSLSGIVTGIFGLDTRPMRRSVLRRRVSASGPGDGDGVAATTFAKRYNFPTAYNGVTLDGSGQNLGIIELGGGFDASDLAIYFSEVGVPTPNVVSVAVGAANNLGPDPNSDGEVMLDIEVAGTVAPKANIFVYFGVNTGEGFRDAISAAVHDGERKIDVISISWGSPEPPHGDKQELDDYHSLFVAASSLGITVCAASGDHGAAMLDASHWAQDGKIHVSHPACDPNVLACGGTQIDPASGADVVWNDGFPFTPGIGDGGGWATGGGISQCYDVPDYQQGIQMPAVPDGGTVGRGLPDIAMSATNYFTRVDSGESASGGTSAVAPLMASLVALLNQAKGKNAGLLQPILYAPTNAAAVKDVTQGTNAIAPNVPGYNAGPGWDACTGLGTPDGTVLLNLL